MPADETRTPPAATGYYTTRLQRLVEAVGDEEDAATLRALLAERQRLLDAAMKDATIHEAHRVEISRLKRLLGCGDAHNFSSPSLGTRCYCGEVVWEGGLTDA